jgi:hypothetical protein
MPPKPAAKAAKNAAPAAHYAVATRAAPVVIRPLPPHCLPSLVAAGASHALLHTTVVSQPADAPGTVSRESALAYRVHPAATADALVVSTDLAVTLPSGETDRPLRADCVTALDCGTSHVVIATLTCVLVGGSNEFAQLGEPQRAEEAGSTTPSSAQQPLRLLGVPPMIAVGGAAPATEGTAALAPPPRVLSVAAGSKHTLAVVMRTRDDAFFCDPAQAAGFSPYSEVLGCGFTPAHALGSRGRRFEDQGLQPIDAFRFEGVDRAWAADDMSFFRGRRGLVLLGSHRAVTCAAPTLVARDAPRVVDVAASEDAIFVLCEGGVLLRCDGSAGDGAPIFANVTDECLGAAPRPLMKRISAGRQHCVALSEDGVLYGWGANSFGQLGDGIAATDCATKLTVVCDIDTRPASAATIPEKPNSASSAQTAQTAPATGRSLGDTLRTIPQADAEPVDASLVANVACGPYCTIALLGDGTLRVLGRSCIDA